MGLWTSWLIIYPAGFMALINFPLSLFTFHSKSEVNLHLVLITPGSQQPPSLPASPLTHPLAPPREKRSSFHTHPLDNAIRNRILCFKSTQMCSLKRGKTEKHTVYWERVELHPLTQFVNGRYLFCVWFQYLALAHFLFHQMLPCLNDAFLLMFDYTKTKLMHLRCVNWFSKKKKSIFDFLSIVEQLLLF